MKMIPCECGRGLRAKRAAKCRQCDIEMRRANPIFGEGVTNWKGTEAGEKALHLRARKAATGRCTQEGCDFVGRTHMAHLTHQYHDESGYVELCPKHHYEYDVRVGLRPSAKEVRAHRKPPEVCKHDHPFTPENTIRTPSGHRACRTCVNRRQREGRKRRRFAKFGNMVQP